MEGFGDLMRMVNRSDGVVDAVFINGRVAFENGAISPSLGRSLGFGTFLPASGTPMPMETRADVSAARAA